MAGPVPVHVLGDRSVSVRAVAATFGLLAFISVSLRCYVRLKVVKFFGWDDGLMVVALGFYTMLSVCMVVASFYGTGQHEANLTEENIIIAKRLWWLCEISYAFASMAVKSSICLFLLRITVLRLHIWILYSVMVTTICTCIVFMFVLLLQCHPLTYFWDKSQPGGHCVDWNVIIAMSWLWSVFAGICDFTVGILPIFLVWNLQMDRRTKCAVVGILGVACIASSATIIRMPFLHTFADPDWLWATTDIALWTDIEVGLGIFASCLATLRPLLRVVRNHSSSSNMNYQNQNPNDYIHHSDRLRHKHNGTNPSSSNPFRLNFMHPHANNLGITMTTVHSTAGEYDNNGTGTGPGTGSADHLNRPLPEIPQIRDSKQEYLVQKSFEVTVTESVPLEHV